MALTTPKQRIIESTGVAPPPGSLPDNVSLPLTFFDVYWVHFPPVERLFFYPYPHPLSHFLSSLLPSLKSSLSLTLKTYYPLAGNLRHTPETEDKFEHYYVEGDSVSFIVAESDENFEDLSKDQEREVSQLQFLVPELLKKDDELQPIFAVQVTVFPQQGVVIGTSIHHSACDGSSSMQFMHSWAARCLSETLAGSVKGPLIDRTLICDPSNIYPVFYGISKMIGGMIEKNKSATETPKDQVLHTFTLNQNHIEKLKKLISTKAEQMKTYFRCSTIVVAFAYIWVGFAQTKSYENAKKVCFGVPADFRSRIQPPIPTEYFGNCVWFCAAFTQASDLIHDDGIFFAAEAIAKAIERMNDSFKDVVSFLGQFKGGPVIGVAGSPKFLVYEIDFGIGKPVKVDVVSAAKSGSISIAESREEKGGVEIGLALTKSEMGCFKKYFFNCLENLIE